VTSVSPSPAETRHGVIGNRLPRVEDPVLLTGKATFSDDVRLAGLLDVAFARSLVAHAAIRSVDASRARSMPGVEAVFTSSDLSEVDELTLTPPLAPPNGPCYSTPRPLLARDRVRFVGEAIAAVVARSRYLAEDACELIEVDQEELPALGSVEHALQPGATLLHPIGSNILFEHEFDSGGVDQEFAEASIVVDRSFRVPRLAPAPLEPRAIVAAPTDSGLSVWYSTQTPYVLRRALSELLELAADEVKIVCPHVGGGFGMKSHVYPEDVLIPLFALRLGRPVRWIEDRAENLVASCHARGQELRLRAAVRRDGVVTALEAETSVDVGAYGIYPHGQLLEALGTPVMMTGPYRIRNYRFRARAVATNKCPGGGYRGVGLAAAVFAHERLMDVVAEATGLDAAEVRRRNLIRKDELPWANPIGLAYDSGDYPEALELALEHIGYPELDALRNEAARRGKLTGIGLSAYVEYTGMGSNVFQERGMLGITGHEEARVSLGLDGSVRVTVSFPSTGQGSETACLQVAADVLQVAPSRITIGPVDTASGVDGSGSFGSRGTVVGASAVALAARALRDRLFELAARELGAEGEDLELHDGNVRMIADSSRAASYSELAAAAPPGYLDVLERHDPPETTFSYGVHACLVEVDPALGTVELLRYVIVDDCGRVINPLIVEGQAHGSTAQGIGAALFERVEYTDGAQPITGSFVDYLLPLATDVPSFKVHHLEHPPPESPAGFKGVGEGGTVAAPPAVANAIAFALGLEVNEIPATPALITGLLEGARQSQARERAE
jgi:carbon-monoxide dehydrogenase large subunit